MLSYERIAAPCILEHDFSEAKPLTGVSSDATFSPFPSVDTSVCGGCVRGGSASGWFTPSSGSVRGVLMRPLPPPPKSFDNQPPAQVHHAETTE